jgi:nitrogen-specific signal transduction histidine kinase/CheY-like chemotaxis protein
LLSRAQAERVAEETLAGIGQLAAGVAHEINNPLAFVVSNLSVLSQYVRQLKLLLDLYRTERYSEAARLAEQIDPEMLVQDLLPLIDETLEGSNRVQNIVRKLRGFTSVQGADRITELNVQAVLESVLNIMHGELRRRLFVKREFEAVPKVRGDRSKLSQVFLNLLTNAANSIPEAEQGQIIVRLFAKGSDVAIQFEDNGRGIPQDRLARVLEPFEAVEDIAVGGLDLAIADEIVRRHGGRIEVVSEDEAGSAFTVWLPTRSTVPLPMIVQPSPPDEPRGAALFIDDERFLLNAYRRAFGRRVKVHIAHGGEEGIRMLEGVEKIDVVFCDLVMPRVSGIEVWGWIKTHRPELLERFVVITGGQHGERNREFLEHTRLPVVHKPFRVKDVVEMINRFTGRRPGYQ